MRRQRGFMTIGALFVVALVTAAVAIVAAAGVADARRTRQVVTDAQLRQLLLAAGTDVAARAEKWTDTPTGSWSIAVPPSLVGYAAKATATTAEAGSVNVFVAADGEGRHASQRMTWTKSNRGWRLTDVGLTSG